MGTRCLLGMQLQTWRTTLTSSYSLIQHISILSFPPREKHSDVSLSLLHMQTPSVPRIKWPRSVAPESAKEVISCSASAMRVRKVGPWRRISILHKTPAKKRNLDCVYGFIVAGPSSKETRETEYLLAYKTKTYMYLYGPLSCLMQRMAER